METITLNTKSGTAQTLPVSGNGLVTFLKRPRTPLTIEPRPQTDGVEPVTENLEIVSPTPLSHHAEPFEQRTKPIQVWEGVVLSIDRRKSEIFTKLRAKMGVLPEHTATFDFEWIPAQDMDLVIPGAVFYLTLFRRLNRGSIQNTQEIRFRRLPSWSNLQIQKVTEAADALGKGMRVANVVAED
jgi:hypothetical protein